MRMDVVDLARFYRTALGGAVEATFAARVTALWSDAALGRVLGAGYAPPVLERLRPRAERCVWMAPAEAGGHIWPSGEPSATALTEERHFPVRDNLFDRVVLLHALEDAASPLSVLREVWRVLAPEGRLILIVTRRLSLWAAFESTPFGRGRPFSVLQLKELMENAMFEVTATSRALHFPPFDAGFITRRAELWERAASAGLPIAAGAILMEAIKRVGARPPRGTGLAPAFVRIVRPAPAPVPATGRDLTPNRGGGSP